MKRMTPKRTKKQIRAMLKESMGTLDKMVDVAFNSGALPDHWKEGEDNHLIARAVLHCWMKQMPFDMLDIKAQKEMRNLEHFI